VVYILPPFELLSMQENKFEISNGDEQYNKNCSEPKNKPRTPDPWF